MRRLLMFGFLASSVMGAPAQGHEGRLVFSTVHSEALGKNLLGDPADAGVVVYLPPSYDAAPSRRYPVVYLLHGNGGSARRSWVDGVYQGLNMKTAMDAAISSGRGQEFIVVMPDANTRYSGSHYVNSSVNGNWADFLAHELVRHIDKTYRTIPEAASRGLAGHSMGGRGTFFLAATVPGVFGAIYALSLGRMGFEAFAPIDDATWRRVLAISDPANPPADVRVALGFATAYSPNPSKPPLFVDFPVQVVDDRLRVIDAVFDRWIAKDPITLVAKQPENLRPLAAIHFSCGTEDTLIGANRLMADVLTKAGLKFTFEEYKGDHNGQIRERIETKVIPMFSKTLAFQVHSQR
jgi:S-formylglutathione hydrolase